MAYIRISVLDKMENRNLAQEYCRDGESACPCPAFTVGQVFITDFNKPENFCEWAWNDIYKYVAIFLSGGNMGDSFRWMKDNHNVIACCTDGIRPVVFKIERVD